LRRRRGGGQTRNVRGEEEEQWRSKYENRARSKARMRAERGAR